MQQSLAAFTFFKKLPAGKRAAFLEAIANEMEAARPQLVAVAGQETHLPEARLNGEIGRTTGQLRLFANLIREGSWVEASIDMADPDRTPPRPDLRKMLVPTGPVVVFGASNFPFAFSTAGGDTASALAAGCTVVVKGHPAHAQTSLLVFEAMERAMMATGMPPHTVQHVAGTGNAIGKALVQHPGTGAVGFTGSFTGGMVLFRYAQERDSPIPVFAEMSSLNPVVFYPDALEKNAAAFAASYAASVTLGAGQFCTNPGLLLGIQSPAFEAFLTELGQAVGQMLPQDMLHEGIYRSYTEGLHQMLQQPGVALVGRSSTTAANGQALPLIAKVTAKDFLDNPQHLAEELFGPYSLAVVCTGREELATVLQRLKGQLTTTLMATEKDTVDFADIVELQHSLAGRIILNQVPTGVEVCASMAHGGPFPATTDARFTSVGSSAIRRWVRPVCFQNFLPALLPDELKNENLLGIMRLVNEMYTREAIKG